MMLLPHTDQRTQRDGRGRFTKGNQVSAAGGQARAKALTPKQRKAISRKGWRAMVRKHFAGDDQAARAWLGALGAWAYDQAAGAGNGIIAPAYSHPGAPGEFLSRRYQLSLFDALNVDVNFYKDGGQ
ncbi:MAG: hypothetical protein R3C14_22680 [Caldilineaceae bacterium]